MQEEVDLPPTNAPELHCLTEASIVSDLLGLLECGPRFTGSAAEAEARRYILDKLSGLGLPARELPYDYVGWTLAERPILEITTPERKSLDAMAFIHSAGTSPAGVHGRLHYLGHHWVIGCFDWMKFAILDAQDRIVGYVSARRDGPPIPQPLDQGSAVVPHFIVGSDGFQMLDSWAQGGATITVDGVAACRAGGKAVSANIIASYLPSKAAPFRVLVTAHLDSMWGAPGSNDNGGGSAAVLALARAVSGSPLPFAVDFIWFTGEESDLLGSRAYVNALSDADLKQIRLLMNLDGIAEAGEQLHIWPGNEDLEYQILQCLREYPQRRDRRTRHIYTFPPRPGMDHVPFYQRGLMDMVSFTGFEMVNYHTSRDVFHPEQGRNLEYAAGIAWHLLRSVSPDPSGPVFRDRLQLRTFAAAQADLGIPGRAMTNR